MRRARQSADEDDPWTMRRRPHHDSESLSFRPLFPTVTKHFQWVSSASANGPAHDRVLSWAPPPLYPPPDLCSPGPGWPSSACPCPSALEEPWGLRSPALFYHPARPRVSSPGCFPGSFFRQRQQRPHPEAPLAAQHLGGKGPVAFRVLR